MASGTLASLLEELPKINPDDVSLIIRQFGMIAELSAGKEYATAIRKRGAAVLRVAGTIDFKTAYGNFLTEMDDHIYSIMEAVREANAVIPVFAIQARARAYAHYTRAPYYKYKAVA